ncbi:MAG: hypothetical protein L0241_07185 [Planctomycetia bacterium]|nr:hypothetical protein [Planctomycetia bacterium]
MPPKKVAAIVTEYRKWSHADVILRNLLDGYPDGKKPNLELVSIFTDQVPATDMSRDLARKHGFRICDTVTEAIRVSGKTLAVDGVLSIGEHGLYPDNAKGQKLYPRRRFFADIAQVFEDLGKSVPVFADKHLAATWEDAKWMYDRARKLFVPMFAGSSIPVTWRKPDLVLPKDCEITGAVQIGYGPFEGYGFHALEGLQCMVERRKGGETGVKAVTCHTGKAMWDCLDRHEWTKPLIEAMLALITAHAKGDIRELTAKAKNAGTFEVEYRDGFRAFVVIPNGWIHENDGASFYFACQRKGQDKPDVCQFYLQQPDPFAHFAELTKAIDSLVSTGHAPYPLERTLLTTGILDSAMNSRHEGGKRLDTPHLEIKYSPTEWPPAKGEIPKAQK